MIAQCTLPVIAGVTLSVFAAGQARGQSAPVRHAYYGETHVHTGWSFDAYIFGNTKTGPADAYKYAMGLPITHPMGYQIKIEAPLDWMGVTDHSEYVGTIALANTPGSPISKLPVAESLKIRNPADVQRVYLWLGNSMIDNQPVKSLVSPEVAGTVWKENNAIADQYNKPGTFTAFCSYEWSSTPNNRNLHRNIFFRDCTKVPERPFSSLDSQDPTDLWNWMDAQRARGNELLAISHNPNLSDGSMFPIDVNEKGRPIDAAWAASRDRNERLTEIKQIKGQSETHPTLSPNDEFANYEILTFLLGDPEGRPPVIPGSYVRQGFKDGLTMMAAYGYNPYKTGIVGGSDSHDTGTPYRQTNFFGAHGINDGELKERMSGRVLTGMDLRYENPAGLTGIWAEENTRASLWDGMQRKETFGTSGPHIQIRMFGGWNYAPGTEKLKNWAAIGYEKGVPMGADLPAAAGKSPTFIVWAVKDPTSGNLDRLQIVKGWSKSGQSFEKVYDVAWAGARKRDTFSGQVPPIGSTVNVAAATYTNTIGAIELKATWTDPDFEPALDAFYYARVLEIPTPRWTTIQAKEFGIAPPEIVPATVQERAWGSPIWYTPAAAARATAKNGMTVADLKAKGAVALDDSALAKLLVGHSTWLQNNVTDSKFVMAWAPSGILLIGNVNPRALQPSDVGDISRAAYLGQSSAYTIKDGKIQTTVGNALFQTAVFKLGDKYYGARSNEFGYANYEIIAVPAQLGDHLQIQLQ